MFYIIYKTTNKINGKYYIGKHKTKNLDDGYLGSGKLLKRAIKKHGVENFEREIIKLCESEDEMNIVERELVTPGEDNYNLCEGGKGGFSYINETISKDYVVKRAKMGYRAANLHIYNSGRVFTLDHRRKLSEAASRRRLSEETKNKISLAKMGNQCSKGVIPWNKGSKRT